MKTIKLFEDFYSTLPSGMKMEDVVKLSPDDFLKLAEETLRSGAGTDQNEFHTIVKTYFSENQKAKADINILTRFGKIIDKYGLDPDTYAPVLDEPSEFRLAKRIKAAEDEVNQRREKYEQAENEVNTLRLKLRKLKTFTILELESKLRDTEEIARASRSWLSNAESNLRRLKSEG